MPSPPDTGRETISSDNRASDASGRQRSAADFIGLFHRCGILVPDNVSVCGYISGPEFHHFHRIAPVDFSPYELGEYAVSLVLRILNGETGQPGEEMLLVSFQDGETPVNLNTSAFPSEN